MTGSRLLNWDLLHSSSVERVSGEDSFIRDSIAYQLRNCGIEQVAWADFRGTPAPIRRISGAIFLALSPRQLELFIYDAKVSVAMAIQRHLSDDLYRMRLVSEPHYCALRPYLSEGFRILMVRPSNWSGYRSSSSRGRALAASYQNEIELLEMEFLAGAEWAPR